MQVLVLGATGTLGRPVVEKMISAGHAVRILARNAGMARARFGEGAEEALRGSGIPHTVFCPTWVMEVLCNFVKADRAVVIEGKNPPGGHPDFS